MMHESSPVSSLTLEEVAKQFKIWRNTRPRRRSIPPRLWQTAVCLSSNYSVSQISKSLGLSYAELKKRVSALPGAELPEHDPHPKFIELDLGQSCPVTSCVLEKEDKHGSRTIMTIKVSGGSDLPELVKAFCSQG